MTGMRAFFTLCLALGMSACGGDDEPEAAATGAAPVAGMAGMAGMATSDTTGTARMEAHLRTMESASVDSLAGLLPGHRQMVANLIARMNGEMRDMSMPADAAWSATVDSLRQDLRRMPEMSNAELRALMPGHHARVRRLTDQ